MRELMEEQLNIYNDGKDAVLSIMGIGDLLSDKVWQGDDVPSGEEIAIECDKVEDIITILTKYQESIRGLQIRRLALRKLI